MGLSQDCHRIPGTGRERFTLTPLLGSAVQPSSAWEALESKRMTRESGGNKDVRKPDVRRVDPLVSSL